MTLAQQHYFRTLPEFWRSAMRLSAIVLWAVLCLPASPNHFNLTDDLDHVSFEGMVNDANGNAVIGARVFVKHTASNNERMMVTTQEGRYRFGSLIPGEYELHIQATN